jgi:hypothetical protein
VTPNGGDITAQWSSGTDRIFTLLEAVDVEQLMKEGLTLRNLVRKWLQRSIRFGDREFEREGSLWMPGPKMVQTPARLASNA